MTDFPQAPVPNAPQAQWTPPAATAEQTAKLNSLVNLTWITAGVYALLQLASLAGARAIYESSIAQLESSGANSEAFEKLMSGPNYTSPIIGLILGLGLFALVGLLLKKGKNGGRITGFVFAGLGILSACLTVLGAIAYPQPWMLIFLVLSIAWLACGIIWIVKATNKDVSAALAAR